MSPYPEGKSSVLGTIDYANHCAYIYRRLCPFLECCFNACGVLFTSIERDLVQIPAQSQVLSLCIPSSVE